MAPRLLHSSDAPPGLRCRSMSSSTNSQLIRVSRSLLFAAAFLLASALPTAAESYLNLQLKQSGPPALRLISTSQTAMRVSTCSLLEGYQAVAADVCMQDAASTTQPLRLRGGAKSKNHTNHNQIRKAHRNGIKRVKT
jgi:hypothetical protein